MRSENYIIRGGVRGRERLRLISRVMKPTSHDLLQRAGIRSGMACLDLGCGGGDLAFDMARMVGPEGRVVGTDIDPQKLDLARREATEQSLNNLEFRFADITETELEKEFDLVHARFLLTHLADSAQALLRMRGALRRNGVIVLEDIDLRGYFCHPECPALWRYAELYTEAVRRKGGDANIGPRLPSMLIDAGFSRVHVNVVQPSGIVGEVKLVTPLTMENIADAVLAEGLASLNEIKQLVRELYEFAKTPGTFGCLPRVVEVWASNSES
jgi:SAM-dependent methyltransferase